MVKDVTVSVSSVTYDSFEKMAQFFNAVKQDHSGVAVLEALVQYLAPIGQQYPQIMAEVKENPKAFVRSCVNGVFDVASLFV